MTISGQAKTMQRDKSKPQPKSKPHDALRAEGAVHPDPERARDSLFTNSDFFDPADLVQVKYEMLRHVRTAGLPVTQAAAGAGLSRPAYYEAQAAFAQGGIAALIPHKRGPHGPHKLSAEVVAFIEQARSVRPRPMTADIERQVHERFAITIHRRSIERAPQREEERP